MAISSVAYATEAKPSKHSAVEEPIKAPIGTPAQHCTAPPCYYERKADCSALVGVGVHRGSRSSTTSALLCFAVVHNQVDTAAEPREAPPL